MDGADGMDGIDGQDGADGNANVNNYRFISPSWGTTGSGMIINMPGILTEEVIENNLILIYVQTESANRTVLIPGSVWDLSRLRYVEFSVNINGFTGGMSIVSREADGAFTLNGDLEPLAWVNVVIAESLSGVTTNGNELASKTENFKDKALKNLSNAGVDVNDYHAVCDYYGIEY